MTTEHPQGTASPYTDQIEILFTLSIAFFDRRAVAINRAVEKVNKIVSG